MSDPVKSVEIEDVLSSIRRLLSDGENAATEARPAASERAVAPNRVTSKRGAAPLVLTPALRVGSGDAPAQTSEHGRDDHAEGAEPTPDEVIGAAISAIAAEAARAETAEGEAGQAHRERGAAIRSRLQSTIAELEAAITHRSEEWEPDGSEAAPVMDWEAVRGDEAAFLSRRHPPFQADGAARPAPVEAPSEPDEEPSMASRPEPQQPAPEGQAGAARLQPVPDEEPMPEPHLAMPPQAEAPFDESWDEPAAEPERDVLPGPAAPAPAESRGASLAETAEAALDPDMLKDIVREVLREELDGELGERITRNVRKLVRREIFRALSTGEFD
ncbi:hypothetical protein [Limimaricola pyoseonensis]|uniref:Uncharacterized protein n=1 Tax=Limimaricola pyoseonensis TaxID=521013 RepID=A0A1G7DFF8_9RHOB|nr:hypothetical protein [Limimaricola pyoseonensis]SDE50324.1 hypothetical protein SAMN04488567_1920 [Limimaricola pyoseonensis]